MSRGLDGCWDCADFPCGIGMFAKDHDIRIRAFVRYIRDHGKPRLAEALLANERMGIRYGHDRDYDHLGSEEKVIQLLIVANKHDGRSA